MADHQLRGELEYLFNISKLNDTEEAKKLLSSIPEDITVPETVSQQLREKLLTADMAKTNKDIARHFKGQYLDSMDNRVNKYIGLADEKDVETIKAEKDTLKKVDAFFQSVEQQKKTATQNKGGDNSAYVEQINALRSEKEKLANDFEQHKVSAASQLENERKNWVVRGKLNSLQIADSFKREDFEIMALGKLNTMPYAFKETNGVLKAYNKETPDVPALGKNGKEITIDDVLNEIASPYIKRNDASNGQPKTTIKVGEGGEKLTAGQRAAKEHYEQFKQRTGAK